MQKLSLTPDIQNYAVSDVYGHIHTRLQGGRSRIRRDYLGTPLNVNVQWTCDEQEYNYLQTFYRATGFGCDAFKMDLILEAPGLLEHTCNFVPKSFQLASVRGPVYIVRATLEVIPPVPDSAYDEGLVTTFEAFGQDGAGAYEVLRVLVNISMPTAFAE